MDRQTLYKAVFLIIYRNTHVQVWYETFISFKTKTGQNGESTSDVEPSGII